MHRDRQTENVYRPGGERKFCGKEGVEQCRYFVGHGTERERMMRPSFFFINTVFLTVVYPAGKNNFGRDITPRKKTATVRDVGQRHSASLRPHGVILNGIYAPIECAGHQVPGEWKILHKPIGRFARRILFILCIVILVAGIGMPVHAARSNGSNSPAKPAVQGNPPSVSNTSGGEQFTDPVLEFTEDQMDELQHEIDTSPAYTAPGLSHQIPRGSLSLLPDLPYNATERNQGGCGNCWVWASTGAIEIGHTIESGIRDRLSIQYFNDNYGNGPDGENSACCGSNPNHVVNWYDNKTANPGMKLIPWSNTNAFYAPHQACNSPVSSSDPVSTSPAYQLNSISITTVPTYGVSQSTAINNIKSALNNNQPVVYGFWYSHTDMKTFQHWWHTQPETDVWDPTPFNGDSGDVGHFVLIVGYDDKTDPDNPCWLVVNSWGAPSNRPDGTFRISMNMNYNAAFYRSGDTSKSHRQHLFQVINASFTDTPRIPVIGGILPPSGPGGTPVTITGIGFTKATAVSFGGTPAASFTVTSDSTITATAPAGSIVVMVLHGGHADVTVTTPLGTSATSAADVYSYGALPATGTTSTTPRSGVDMVPVLGALALCSAIYVFRKNGN